MVFAAPLLIAFLGMFGFFALRGEGFFSIENFRMLHSKARCSALSLSPLGSL